MHTYKVGEKSFAFCAHPLQSAFPADLMIPTVSIPDLRDQEMARSDKGLDRVKVTEKQLG